MTGAVGSVQIPGSVARDIDRMMGRLPALDKAIQARYPGAQREVGAVMKRFGRQNVQVQSGELRDAIDYRVEGGLLKFGVYGADHAAAVEWGFKHRELVSAHDREVTSVFGMVLDDPRTAQVRQHVREQNKPARPFFLRAYYDSFRAMFGILNRIIKEAEKEVGLGG